MKKLGCLLIQRKNFRNAFEASFWGISVDGSAGTMRPNPQRVWPLCVDNSSGLPVGVVHHLVIGESSRLVDIHFHGTSSYPQLHGSHI